MHAPALEPLELKMNFRSHAGVVDRLNEVFAEVFAGDRAGDGYHVGFAPSVASSCAPSGMEKSVHVAAQFLRSNAGADEKIAARRTEAAQVLRVIQQHAPEMEAAKAEGRPFRIAVLVRAKQHLTEIVRQLAGSGNSLSRNRDRGAERAAGGAGCEGAGVRLDAADGPDRMAQHVARSVVRPDTPRPPHLVRQ